MVAIIRGDRPALLRAVMDARDFELRREEIREDLLEFATFILLAELSGQRIGAQTAREPFAIALIGFGGKYANPRILRDLAQLVRAGAPL